MSCVSGIRLRRRNIFKMNDRGCWTTQEEMATHEYDAQLCEAMIASFPVRTVADIGCGRGDYTRAFREANVFCRGFDGNPLTKELCDACEIRDFSEPQDIGVFDLVVSLEVGEHIPAEYESIFLDNICKASKEYVCLSWAIEGQEGTGHVNCQNNGYIINEMQRRGFEIDWEHTEYLREKSTLSWFKNTIMVFEKL